MAGIIAETAYILTTYYASSEYIAYSYVKGLVQKDYEKIYDLLDKTSTSRVGSSKEVIDYYKKIYDREKMLVDVKMVSTYGNAYRLQYMYKTGQELGNIQIVKDGNKWRVVFPFEFNDVEVFAPNGCEIYVDGQKLKSTSNGKYVGEHILPGTYMLQVNMPLTEYENYYKMIHIPEDTTIVLPYETGAVKIHTAPGLKINMGPFERISNQKYTLMSDLLVGDYTISVADPNGWLKTQYIKTSIKKGVNDYYLEDYTLTLAGETKCENFWEAFYNKYIEGIEKHQTVTIKDYVNEKNQKKVIGDYFDWYINKKDICDAEFSYKCGEKYIDDTGKLHQEVVETAVLYNNEINDEGEAVVRVYKLNITWQVVVRIQASDWLIETRDVKESIVAVKDQEGKWVQY